jgi:endonuclease/exonuclease/phosphatase (EEP) superfamily protein YafD
MTEPVASARTSRRRPVLLTLAVLACVAVGIPSLVRATGAEPGQLTLLMVGMPFVALASVVALGLALLSRSRAVIAVAVALLVANVAWQLPLFVPDPGPSGHPVLRVAASNLKFGHGDPQAIVDLVRTHDIDVLALEELTPDAVRRLHDAGLDALLPFHEARPDPSFTGTGLWSRTPLRDAHELPGFSSTVVVARVTPGAGDLTVLAIHPLAPVGDGLATWEQEYADLLSATAAMSGPVVGAGDFNATRDQKPFRDLESAGFRDAVDQAGAGFQPTFPNTRRGRPLMAIDHVIARDLPVRATAFETVDVPGSDHRAVVATYG